MPSLQTISTARSTARPSANRSQLVVIGRSSAGSPRTYRLDRPAATTSRAMAYRRLALTILELDVPSLAAKLVQQRRAARA